MGSSSSAEATGAAATGAARRRSLPSIKSKRNRPAPRSKARAGFGPPLGFASRARMAHKDGQRALGYFYFEDDAERAADRIPW